MKTPVCPYCGKPSKQVGGRIIYPHRSDLYGLTFYLCAEDDAYVGSHYGSKKPLGTLANKELRSLRSKTHIAFDALWKRYDLMSRNEAYKWLSEELGLPKAKTHIAMFNEELCNKTIKLSENKRLALTSNRFRSSNR